jgi:hypothetical protein
MILKKKSKMKFNQKDDNNTENEDQLNSFYINEESDINNDKDYINEDESIEQLNFQSELNNSYSSLTELSKLKGKSKKESEEEEEESYLSSFFSHHSSSFYIHENELSFSDSVYSSSLNSINLDSSLNSNSDLNSRRRRKSSSTGTNNNQDNLLIQNQSEDFIIRDESFSSISTINSQSSHHSSLYSYDDNNIRINVNDDNKPDFTQRLQKENVEYNDDSHKSNLPRTISLTRLKEYHDIHHHIDQEKILSHKGSYKLNLNLNINRNQPSISTIPSHHSTVSISSNKKKVIHKSSLASSIFSVHSHSKSNSISSNSTNNEHKGISSTKKIANSMSHLIFNKDKKMKKIKKEEKLKEIEKEGKESRVIMVLKENDDNNIEKEKEKKWNRIQKLGIIDHKKNNSNSSNKNSKKLGISLLKKQQSLTTLTLPSSQSHNFSIQHPFYLSTSISDSSRTSVKQQQQQIPEKKIEQPHLLKKAYSSQVLRTNEPSSEFCNINNSFNPLDYFNEESSKRDNEKLKRIEVKQINKNKNKNENETENENEKKNRATSST